MIQMRFPQSAQKWVRPAPHFDRFLATPGATVVGALMSLGAVAGTALAAWRGHWVDAVVYALVAVLFAGWLGIRLFRGRGGPPHPAH